MARPREGNRVTNQIMQGLFNTLSTSCTVRMVLVVILTLPACPLADNARHFRIMGKSFAGRICVILLHSIVITFNLNE